MSQRKRKSTSQVTKKSKKIPVKADESSGEEEEEEDAAPIKGSRAQKAFDKMSQKDQDQKIAGMMRYIVFNSQDTISYKDLSEKVMTKTFSLATPIVLEKTKEKLLDVFGYELVNLPYPEAKHQHPKELGEDAARMSSNYVVANTVEFKDKDIRESVNGSAENGLLMTILAQIYMDNMEMGHRQLWNFLGKFGVRRNVTHPTFGNCEHLIDRDFTKQRYLTKVKKTELEGTTYLYRWGPRARALIGRDALLTFIANVYGEDVEEWLERIREEEEFEETAKKNRTKGAADADDAPGEVVD